MIERLAQASEMLSRVLAAWGSRAAGAAARPGASDQSCTPIDLELAFAEVIQMRELLRRLPAEPDPELAQAIADYRQILQQLKLCAPAIRGWLLAERARLGNRKAHSASVQEWIATHGETRLRKISFEL